MNNDKELILNSNDITYLKKDDDYEFFNETITKDNDSIIKETERENADEIFASENKVHASKIDLLNK